MKYKVNLRKIFALIVSVALVISAFAVFSVSADDETGMTNQEYYSAQSYLVAKYKDGDISYSEFQQRSQAVTDEFVSKNTVGGVLQSGALNASNTFNAVSQKIGDTVQKYGDSAREHISDCVSDFLNDYIKLSDVPTTDLDGSTAFYRRYYDDGSGYEEVYCRTSGIVKNRTEGNESWKEYWLKDCYRKKIFKNNGVLLFDYELSGTEEFVSDRYGLNKRTDLHGKWVMENGEPAYTDDEFQTISDYDFSEAPERELEDLLKKILNEFELQQPDLSSIEGLLNAIYARLGTLDSDNDNTSLSLINSTINKLISENKESNDEIIKKLENLKLETDNQAILDKLNEIFPEYDFDTDISRTEELKILFLTKWAFVEELRTLIDRFMSSYEQNSSLGTMDNVIHVKYHPSNGSFGNVILNYNGAYDIRFDIFEPYLPTVRGLIAAFIYLSYAFNTYRKIPSYIRGGDAK